MKKIYLILFFFVTINLQNASAQCCPYLGDIKLAPTAATTNDSIYLIIDVSTPNQGHFLGYEITETDSLTTVNACYYSGLLTAIQTYHDTLNLGVQDAGTFKVKFVAWQSLTPDTCDYSENNSIDLEVEIENVNSTVTPTVPTISVFPNPVKTGQLRVKAKDNFEAIQFYNQLGILVFQKNKLQTNELYLNVSHFPQGVYFLKGTMSSGFVFSKKIILEK